MKVSQVVLHITWMNFINNLLTEKSDKKACIPYDSIYMKFKTGKLSY